MHMSSAKFAGVLCALLCNGTRYSMRNVAQCFLQLSLLAFYVLYCAMALAIQCVMSHNVSTHEIKKVIIFHSLTIVIRRD